MPTKKRRKTKWEKTELPALTPDEKRLVKTMVWGRLTSELLAEYLTFVISRREAIDTVVGKVVAGWPSEIGRRAKAKGS